MYIVGLGTGQVDSSYHGVLMTVDIFLKNVKAARTITFSEFHHIFCAKGMNNTSIIVSFVLLL